MPKATKKKKEKHADFTKAKLKLGKGKQQPSNATDTSFKARSIALPGQHSLDRVFTTSDEPTTSHGLTLEDVLIRLRHPNAGVRKEALSGLKEIISQDGSREVGRIIKTLGGIISDDDSGVRKALLAFMAWYLPLQDQATLSPHLSFLLLQTSSALSHIFPEIRLDACKLVSLLLEHVPSHVIGSWPQSSGSSTFRAQGEGGQAGDGTNTVLEGLRLAIGLGSEKGMNAQMGKLGAQGRLVTLKAMLDFLRHALGHQETDEAEGSNSSLPPGMFPDWLEDGPGGSKRKGKGKEKAVGYEGQTSMRDEGWVFGVGDWAIQTVNDLDWELARLQSHGVEDGKQGIETLSHLYLQLQPLLLSTFLESAPTALGSTRPPSPSDHTAFDLCFITASLTLTLARPILSASSSLPFRPVRDGIADFIRRMAVYFPFGAQTTAHSSTRASTFDLCLIYSELVLLLAPSLPQITSLEQARIVDWTTRSRMFERMWAEMRDGSVSGGKRASHKRNAQALEEIAEWVTSVLIPTSDMLAPVLSATSYRSLLPIIWPLLVQPPSIQSPGSDEVDISPVVGEAFFTHLDKASPSGSIRATGDELVMNLIMIHEQRFPRRSLFIPLRSALRRHFTAWLDGLLKVLCEFGTKHEQASERVLGFLLWMGKRGTKGLEVPWSLLDPHAFPATAEKLAAFFYISESIKGAGPGPWAKLSSISIRKLSLDVARVWMEWGGESLRNAVDCAVDAGKDNEMRLYWYRQIA